MLCLHQAPIHLQPILRPDLSDPSSQCVPLPGAPSRYRNHWGRRGPVWAPDPAQAALRGGAGGDIDDHESGLGIAQHHALPKHALA